MSEKPKREFAVRVGTANGRPQILKLSPEGVQSAELIPVTEGKPLYGDKEIFAVEQRGPIYRLTRLVGKSGPAQVASKEYRDGWDKTFMN